MLWAGKIPLWTPYVFSGMPFLADPQVGAWYPLNWPFFMIGITPSAIAVLSGKAGQQNQPIDSRISQWYLLAFRGCLKNNVRDWKSPISRNHLPRALPGIKEASLLLSLSVPSSALRVAAAPKFQFKEEPMKRIRFGSALLLVALALGFALASGPSSSADEGGGAKCNCLYPNTGQYGVKNGNDCVVQDCWIEIQ